MSRVEQRLGLTTLTAIIVSIALVFAVGATVLSVIALSDVTQQSQRSCEVQSRGLEATKEILPVWEAINFLVEPHKGVPAADPMFAPALQKLRFHLPRFLALQHKQPGDRHC